MREVFGLSNELSDSLWMSSISKKFLNTLVSLTS
jgi:hypothetical protein